MADHVDLDRVAALRRVEDERFVSSHPRSLELLERARRTMPRGVPVSWMVVNYDHPPVFVESADGACFTDVDGHRYVDFSLGITGASTGHTCGPVLRAVTERIGRGVQFQLPTEDAVVVSEELARRWGLPKWQYQLTSTQAVTEAIRLARLGTGRERIVVFEGKYQGHLAELLAVGDGENTTPEYLGVTDHDIARTSVAPWNDLDAVAAALGRGDVALLLAEPLLTNAGIIFPADGFHAELRRLTRDRDVLLAIDETQSMPMAFGGLVRAWGLDPDMVILGKSLGGGVPVAALGMTDQVASLIDREHAPYEVAGEAVEEAAIGGTLFGNALSMAAARAAVVEVWTQGTHRRMQNLARDLATDLEAAIRSHGYDWNVYHVGNRAGYRFAARPPRNNAEAGAYDVPAVRHLQRVFMANRGIWDFGWWGGPAISGQTTTEHVQAYVGVFNELMDQALA